MLSTKPPVCISIHDKPQQEVASAAPNVHERVGEGPDLASIPAISGHFQSVRRPRQSPSSDTPLGVQHLTHSRAGAGPPSQRHHEDMAPSELDDDLIDPEVAMRRVEAAVSRYVQAFQEDSSIDPSVSTTSYYSPNINSRYYGDSVEHVSRRRARGGSAGEFAPPLPFRM